MGLVFGWKTGSRYKVDPQIAGDRLEKLRAKHGKLDARIVVDDATSKHSPLHHEFEWNDAKAADQHRLSRARHMLRKIVIVPEDEDEEPMRAYTVVTIEEEWADDEELRSVDVYTSLLEAMIDPELRVQVLARARAELLTFKRKYKMLRELAAVMEAIDQTAV